MISSTSREKEWKESAAAGEIEDVREQLRKVQGLIEPLAKRDVSCEQWEADRRMLEGGPKLRRDALRDE